MTVELIQGLLLAFAIVVILMPAYIRLLQAMGMGKRIRAEGPEAHLAKGGTPTMGGLLIIIVVLALFVLIRGVPQRAIIAPLATLLLVGLLGAVDDFLNARTGEGIRAKQKILWLTVVAGVAAFQIQSTYSIDEIAVPFVGAVGIAPWVFVVFAAFAIIAASNGVNLTDGLDGLAGGTLIFAFVAFMLIALLNVAPQPEGGLGNQPNLAFLCALIIGALLGFLWFNVHPAQIFMGDSGSLALGATLAVIALITGQILRSPADRARVRRRDGIGHHPDRLLQADQGQAHLQDGAASPSFRAVRLGRGEDHPPVLDRRDPRRPPRRDPLPRLHRPAAVMTMTGSVFASDGTVDLDALTLEAVRGGALRGRRVTVLGLARTGIAAARYLADAGALVTIYDGQDRARLESAIAALGDRPVTLALGPGVDPAATWAGAGPRRDVAIDHARLPDDRARSPIRPRRTRVRAGRRRTRRAGARLGARPVPPPLPRPHDRRDRDQGQDHDRGVHRGRAGRQSRPSGDARRQYRRPAHRAPGRP